MRIYAEGISVFLYNRKLQEQIAELGFDTTGSEEGLLILASDMEMKDFYEKVKSSDINFDEDINKILEFIEDETTCL